MQLLIERKVSFEIIEYLKVKISPNDILGLSKKLKIPPRGFIRKGEADFKNNNLERFLLDDRKMAGAISEFPKIMERPIAVYGEKAIIGRPSEKVLSLLIEEE